MSNQSKKKPISFLNPKEMGCAANKHLSNMAVYLGSPTGMLFYMKREALKLCAPIFRLVYSYLDVIVKSTTGFDFVKSANWSSIPKIHPFIFLFNRREELAFP